MADTDHITEKAKTYSRGSISLKLVTIGILLLLFLIPSSMVQNLIHERAARQEQTIEKISQTWGNAQTLAGPVLAVPYKIKVTDKESKTEQMYFLPEKLNVDAKMTTQIRSRGIYDVPVYEGEISVSGTFVAPRSEILSIEPKTVLWDEAKLIVGIPDLRGVKEQISLKWTNENYVFSPGIPVNLLTSGVSTRVKIGDKNSYTFSFTIHLRGSQSIGFVPIGKDTAANVSSDWQHPSFIGAFLPDSHKIDANGFTANWHVLDLNRNFPQQWTSDKTIILEEPLTNFGGMYSADAPYRTVEEKPMVATIGASGSGTFGVRMFMPVNVYQKSTRSAKYGIAVIALVFATVFFMEVTIKRRIHAMQYILIGLALVIFYSLLLSLSEYLPFWSAYVLASLATITMITLFTKSVLASLPRALITSGILTILYGFVYVLLQMEEYTLLIGSIGLFAILAIIMYVSRGIRWYGETEDAK